MVAHCSPAYIEDPKQRMTVFKRRSNNLKKSIFELSTLCDVPACVVIYNPEREDGKHYKVWPQERDKISHVLDLYRKSGRRGRACSSSGKPNKKQNKQRQQAEKKGVKAEPNCSSVDDDPEPIFTGGGGLKLEEEKLKNLTPDQAMRVMVVVDQKIGEIQSRIDGKISQAMMIKDVVVHVKVDDADAGALMVVQGMDDDDENHISDLNLEAAAIVNFTDNNENSNVSVADDEVQLFSAVVRKDSVLEVADPYFDFVGASSAANVTINHNYIDLADDPVPVLPAVMRKDHGFFNVADQYFDFGALADDFGACSSLTLPPLPPQPQSYCREMVFNNERSWLNSSSSSDSGREPSLWESILCEDLPMRMMM